MKRITLLMTALLFMFSYAGLAQVESGTMYSTPNVDGLPEGWSGEDGGGTSYIKLIAAEHYIQTANFEQNGFTSVVVKARKFGGPSVAQAQITVSWYDSDNVETVLGTLDPTTTTLTNYSIDAPATVENGTGYIKIQCKGASASKGAGVSEVTINYVVPGGVPTYTVTYDCNGGTEGCPENVTGVESGSTIYLANGPTLEDYDFAGWSDGENTYDEGDEYTVTGNVTFTAQWTAQSGNEVQWVLTNLADLTSTDIFVIVGNNGNNFAMANNGGSSNAPSAIAVTVANNELTSVVTADIQWNISGNADDGYTFYPNGTTETWLYCFNNNNGLRVGTGEDNLFVINNDYLYNSGQGRYIGIYSSQNWRSYTSINSNITGQTFAFYKKVTDGVIPPSISADNVEIAYNATSGSFDFTVNHPVEGGTTTVAEEVDWISNAAISGNSVTFTTTVNEEGTPRHGVITLTYTYNRATVTKDVTVTQAGNPSVTMTIAEVREQGTGDVATIGTVTSCVGTTGYIQDATAAICVYGAELTVGDQIRVEGTLSTYHGLLEITSPVVTVLSSGNTVEPELMTIAEINESTNQGWYVRIEEATVTAISGQNTTIAQGDNTIVVRGISGVEYAVNDLLTLNGNIGCYDAAQIANPQNVDVQQSTEPAITVTPATVNAAAEETTGTLTVTYVEVNEAEAEVYFCGADGMPVSYDWIIADLDADNNVEYVIEANEGEARTAYLMVVVGEIASNLVTINQAEYEAPFTGTRYGMITTTANIESGKHYIIAGWKNGQAYAMGQQNSNNRAAVAINIDDDGWAYVDSSDVYEFVINGPDADGNYFFYDTNEASTGYLYAASSGSNHLKTEEFLDALGNGLWSIEIAEIGNAATVIAQGDHERNWMRFNSNNNPPIFSCYGSTSNQKDIYLFMKEEDENFEFFKDIVGFGNGNGDWHLVSTPFDDVEPVDANMEAEEDEDYDLYWFNPTATGVEWRNYKATPFNLYMGKGYLYASKNPVTLHFEGDGILGVGSEEVPLEYEGFNLVGNPFARLATVDVEDFYVMSDGYEIAIADRDYVKPMEGIFVEAAPQDEIVTFTSFEFGEYPGLGDGSEKLNLKVTDSKGISDVARIRFGEGRGLEKLVLNENHNKLYFVVDGNEYAVTYAANKGEMPVYFKAAEDGTYTLTVSATLNSQLSTLNSQLSTLNFKYLHLIDNLTGAEVDLLVNPSYSFEAKTSDNAARFRLVFSK